MTTAANITKDSISPKMRDYLKIGLFSAEMVDIFGCESLYVMKDILGKYDCVYLANKFAGHNLPIPGVVTRKGKPLRFIARNQVLYHNVISEDDICGATRFVYEILDSEKPTTSIKLFQRVSEKGSMTTAEITNEFNGSASVRTVDYLVSMGLVTAKKEKRGRLVAPTMKAKKILSEENLLIWNDLKKQDFRIDLW